MTAELEDTLRRARALNDELDAEIGRRNARIAELEGALEPFANAADEYRADAADDAVRIHCVRVMLTLGHLRAARAARNGA